jgi:hypothetical protein
MWIIYSMNAKTNNGTGLLLTLISVCFRVITMVYNASLIFILPAAFGKFAENDQMSDAFKLNELFKLLRTAPGAYCIAIFGTVVAIIISPLGFILIGIGLFLTSAYSATVTGYLFGQAIHEAKRALGSPIPIPSYRATLTPPVS